MKDDNYTFENFIASDCNENAYKTCKAFLEEPYGKFVALYGPTASGKTHLLSAIFSKYIELYPDNKIEITTYEKIVSEYIEEIKCMNKNDGYNGSFKDKYLDFDLLLIDNMQFDFGKRYTQGEFVKWFLTMLSQRKSVIIAIDRPVDNYKFLIETLQESVNQCFVIELKEPDVAFKKKYLCEILKKIKGEIPESIKNTLINDSTIPYYTYRGFLSSAHIMKRILGRQMTETEYSELLTNYKNGI